MTDDDYRLGYMAGLGTAMRVCEEIESKHWNTYKRAHPSHPGRANPHYQGLSDGAGECRVAIRELMLKQGEPDA